MKLSKKQIVLSLFFPCLIIILSLLFLFCIKEYRENLNFWEYIEFLIVPIGGALPIFLTIKFNIDTSKFTIDRLIFLPISIAICLISINCCTNSILVYMIIIALVLGLNIMYFYLRTRSYKKLIVITLSNPIMYYPILFLDFAIHLSTGLFPNGFM